jgi:hypothetical protein
MGTVQQGSQQVIPMRRVPGFSRLSAQSLIFLPKNKRSIPPMQRSMPQQWLQRQFSLRQWVRFLL